ncbi:alpha-glucan family phosphorylase [Gimesia algae]|uniref:glycogen phosphorylase n=1 Tax=Gimesia algae TaxID=2527971 RepID=A0A517VF23_9PLAN|nr:alpha-glucan family phosphorylase [Gimesia algae]QDT91567.1 Maltodextrin phosphorylase [Gimesia algae]
MNSNNLDRSVSYFSMEIAIHPEMPTYAGGLGILAGDTIRSAADLQVPMVAITLLHREGYFYQTLDATDWQTEEPVHWVGKNFLTDTGVRTHVSIENRSVKLRAWKYDVVGEGGFVVQVFLLDTDLPENSDWDRKLTNRLYGGDEHYRFCQEVVLGIGGIRMLRALGYDAIHKFHMNEGHSALLTLELLDEQATSSGRPTLTLEDIEAVHAKCVFTTHTPVPAGHDQFPLDLVNRVLGRRDVYEMKEVFCCEDKLNMTFLAMNMSHYINGVAKRHGEVSRHMFARYKIDSITNGVHAATWVSQEFAELFDRYIPDWKQDNFSLRYALSISKNEVAHAHQKSKRRLLKSVNQNMNAGLDSNVFTIGFARRVAMYKRADLIFNDVEQLRRISRDIGRIQIIFSGKAHPKDIDGKKMIQQIIRTGRSLAPDVTVAFLPNYDMELAQLLTAGVDLWLNTPEPPQEASGTSGMKAALNGIPSLSILDGWWIEGCIENITGWAIGSDGVSIGQSNNHQTDADSLYAKLEQSIIPTFYNDQDCYVEIMRHAIALNGSFFNTQRMIQQYVLKAYF